ncbi:hypothetical protein BH10BAC5_BH10BAC5_22790 [soil metagenome]
MNEASRNKLFLFFVIAEITLSLTVITGWITGIKSLKFIIPGQLSMKINIAVCFLLSTVAILFYHYSDRRKYLYSAGIILSYIVLLTGVLTLFEYISGISIGIDELLFKDDQFTTADYIAGRMSPIAALNISLIGIGLLTFHKNGSSRFHFFYLAFTAFSAVTMVMAFNFLREVPLYTRMGIHVSIGFLILVCALRFSNDVIFSRITFEMKLYTGFVSAILLLIMITLFSFYYNGKRIDFSEWVEHSNEVIRESDKLQILIKDIESEYRGYLVSRDSDFSVYFDKKKIELYSELNYLLSISADDSSLQTKIVELKDLINRKIEFAFEINLKKGDTDIGSLLSKNDHISEKIVAAFDDIRNEELRKLREREYETNLSIKSFDLAFYIFLFVVFLLLLFILAAIRNNIQMRRNAEENIIRLNTELENRVAERTNDLFTSEKEYRYLFENNPMAMFIMDHLTYKFLNVNQASIETFGYSREEFLSMSVFDIVPTEERERLKVLSLENVPRTKSTNRGIWNFYKKDGSVIIVEAISRDITFEGTTVRLSLLIDITDKIKAENVIRELNEGLENIVLERTAEVLAVNKELESFSYSVSHDLRSPLRSINGFAKILEEDYKDILDDEGKRLLGIIRYSAKNMGALIDDLLAFSKIGKKDLKKTNINMKKLAFDVKDEIKLSVNHNAIFKINDLRPISGDETLLKQVFLNLMSNSVKYSAGKEQAVIEIWSEKIQNEIKYIISDNGVGFDMEYVEKLFGVFQRLHSTEEFEGTGVGLALVERIITKHKGKVGAKGKVNEGAVFWFSLPL